jgi:hypothetical protein
MRDVMRDVFGRPHVIPVSREVPLPEQVFRGANNTDQQNSTTLPTQKYESTLSSTQGYAAQFVRWVSGLLQPVVDAKSAVNIIDNVLPTSRLDGQQVVVPGILGNTERSFLLLQVLGTTGSVAIRFGSKVTAGQGLVLTVGQGVFFDVRVPQQDIYAQAFGAGVDASFYVAYGIFGGR